jgi:exodeoxyribonuclease VII large subunit
LKPIRVSALNSYIGRILSTDPVLANVSVIGEISNFKRHGSGHVYFTLKDADSKVNCFLPGRVFESVPPGIKDGMEAAVSGRIDVYERGGYYSLIVREISPMGEGGLAVAFERMKTRLEAEGLFDPAAKKPLPAFPMAIAIVTSGTGAAIEDMVKVITAKNDVADILIYPTAVQGPGAAEGVAEGIGYINENHPEADVIIIGRGGGSMEELWAFNEEVVARAIFASDIPVISAVGHETDVTISDFAADVRAGTPTKAAEMAAPDTAAAGSAAARAFTSISESFSARLGRMRLMMDACAMPRLGEMISHRIEMLEMKSSGALSIMEQGAKATADAGASRAESAYGTLKGSDPARIMSMGYAALTKGEGTPVRSVDDIAEGDVIKAHMADGTAELSVNDVTPRVV